MKKLLALIVAAMLCGCASGYSQFYTALPDATPEVVARLRVAPPPVVPRVDRSPTVPDAEYYARLGYAAIGYSSFNSGQSESEAGAIEQAKKVGADLVVIVNPTYTGSVTSHIPVTTPTTSTSHTAGSATAYGTGGTFNAYGSSQTTTYGSRTNYIPMTTNRYDYAAVYFIKRKYSLGASFRDLNNQERAAIQSNSGVVITVVVNDTPAFRDDLLVGDIVTKVNGRTIYGRQEMSDALADKDGQEIAFVILRNGQTIEKRIRLNQ